MIKSCHPHFTANRLYPCYSMDDCKKYKILKFDPLDHLLTCSNNGVPHSEQTLTDSESCVLAQLKNYDWQELFDWGDDFVSCPFKVPETYGMECSQLFDNVPIMQQAKQSCNVTEPAVEGVCGKIFSVFLYNQDTCYEDLCEIYVDTPKPDAACFAENAMVDIFTSLVDGLSFDPSESELFQPKLIRTVHDPRIYNKSPELIDVHEYLYAINAQGGIDGSDVMLKGYITGRKFSVFQKSLFTDGAFSGAAFAVIFSIMWLHTSSGFITSLAFFQIMINLFVAYGICKSSLVPPPTRAIKVRERRKRHFLWLSLCTKRCGVGVNQ